MDLPLPVLLVLLLISHSFLRAYHPAVQGGRGFCAEVEAEVIGLSGLVYFSG